ncbi:hypothetical protein ACFE04_007697 [Oxalis oulophora]
MYSHRPPPPNNSPPLLISPAATTNIPIFPSSIFQSHHENIRSFIQNLKADAEVHYGHKTCTAKFKLFLLEKGLPNGLLILQDIQEFGLVRETGFVWIKHKEKKTYCKFDNNIEVCYDKIVTAYFDEQGKIKKLTGVKAKEFLIWLSLTEIYVDSSRFGSIRFKTLTGLSKSFPLSMFIISSNGEEADADAVVKRN